jgi:hypothetical protein
LMFADHLTHVMACPVCRVVPHWLRPIPRAAETDVLDPHRYPVLLPGPIAVLDCGHHVMRFTVSQRAELAGAVWWDEMDGWELARARDTAASDR